MASALENAFGLLVVVGGGLAFAYDGIEAAFLAANVVNKASIHDRLYSDSPFGRPDPLRISSCRSSGSNGLQSQLGYLEVERDDSGYLNATFMIHVTDQDTTKRSYGADAIDAFLADVAVSCASFNSVSIDPMGFSSPTTHDMHDHRPRDFAGGAVEMQADLRMIAARLRAQEGQVSYNPL